MKVINKKLSVVLLCHFTNVEIQIILKASKKINEYAPWIPMIASIFENQDKIDFYIVSPHEYISKTQQFKLRGVNYFFYNAHMPIIGRHWPGFFKWDSISNFYSNKIKTKNIINKIKPDIIHLFGAENAYYSSTILQFKNIYPVIVSVQGFISKTQNPNIKIINQRIECENAILKTFKNQAVHTETLASDILKLNSNAKLFKVTYPIKTPKTYNEIKKYDLVFFARITQEKGIGDLIKAIALIKETKKDISLCVIGGGTTTPWEQLAEENGVNSNIEWVGFIPTQEDAHKIVSESRICVLPTYHEMISGTIVESMFLKLPVVAYNVGSIHEVNEKEEIISLVDRWDIEGLAKAIIRLLDNPELRDEIAEKGYKRAHEMFLHTDDEVRNSLLNAYDEVIKDFHKA